MQNGNVKMEVVNPNAAGIDVGSRSHFAAIGQGSGDTKEFGVYNEDLKQYWDYTFSEQNGNTKACITIYNESLARMEKMIEMGFTEGMSVTLKNLDDLLATLSQRV